MRFRRDWCCGRSLVSVVHIVGLGPGDAGLVTRQTAELLASGRPVIVRTRRHPGVAMLDPDGRWTACDDLYSASSSFDETYAGIAGRVLEAAALGDVVFAVPGHPLVAEQSVAAILALTPETGHETRVYAAVSFFDAAAAALRREMGTAQLCDALALRVDTWRPALISQVYDRASASRLKLDLLELYPAAHPVTLLRALGTDAEEAIQMPLAELDHRAAGYLDAVYVPPLEPIDDARRFDGLHAVIQRLHGPDGCPWDREQTHASLRPHLLEECYETLEAIDASDSEALSEELGDVLLQVLMHAAVAERSAEFDLADGIEQITRKLVRRHPHVFGEVEADDAEQVYQNWEALKRAERPRSSILDGVPPSLPALAASQEIQGRARRIGFDWPETEGAVTKLQEEVAEFARADGASDREDEFGDILFVTANIAQRLGIDAEQALRRANQKFRGRFAIVEALARERGLDLKELDLAGLDRLWDEAKATARGL